MSSDTPAQSGGRGGISGIVWLLLSLWAFYHARLLWSMAWGLDSPFDTAAIIVLGVMWINAALFLAVVFIIVMGLLFLGFVKLDEWGGGR